MESKDTENKDKKKTRVQSSKKTRSKDNLQTKSFVKNGDEEESATVAAKLDTTRFNRKSNKKILSKKERNCSRNPSSIKKEAEVSLEATSGLCTFKCPQCSLEFANWKRLGKHMKDKHEIVVSVNGPDKYVSKATVHVCRVCSVKIFCDSDLLYYHFKIKHGLKLCQYRQQYGCGESWQSQKQEILKEGIMSQDIIGNLCTFKCALCRKIFYCSRAFKTHNLKSKCPFTLKKQSVLFYIEKVVKHKCKICSKVLLCDKTFIKRHVQRCHKCSIEEYAESNNCTIYDPHSKVRKCAEKSNALLQRVKNGQTSEFVGNLCTYTCDKCSYVARCKIPLSRHLKKTGHGSPSKTMRMYLSKTVFHKCLICERKLLNDMADLDTHMRKTHQQTAPLYVEEFNLTKIY